MSNLKSPPAQGRSYCIYFFADYDGLVPCGSDVPSSNWKWLSLKIECDIGRVFTELIGNKIVYQRGEANLNYHGSSSSLKQLK